MRKLPPQWTTTKLADHLREPIRNGYSPRCPENPTGTWILSLSAVTHSGFDKTGVKPAPLGDDKVAKNLLSAGDIIVSRSNTPDRVGLAGIYEGNPAPCSYPDLLMRVRLTENLDPNFLLAHLLSDAGRRFFTENARGSSGSMVKIDRSILESFSIPTPPIEEQRAIASALSDMDALLAKLDQLIAKKRDIKQAAMQELLTGRRRLPGFSDQWQSLPLGELFSFGGGIPASRDQLSDDGFCYLHYGDIHKSEKTHINIQTERSQIPRLRIKLNDVSPGSLLRNGDVVFVDASEDESGTSKHVVILNPDNEAYISGLHTIVAKPKNSKLTTAFKRFCFQSEEIRKQFRFYAAGTKVCGVSKSSIRKIFLSFPDTAEQDAIGEIFIGMDTEITALEARREKTRLIKQGMMQELLSGRVRLI